jgi:hypothetical protein
VTGINQVPKVNKKNEVVGMFLPALDPEFNYNCLNVKDELITDG